MEFERPQAGIVHLPMLYSVRDAIVILRDGIMVISR
jgi:hypothetical protein